MNFYIQNGFCKTCGHEWRDHSRLQKKSCCEKIISQYKYQERKKHTLDKYLIP